MMDTLEKKPSIDKHEQQDLLTVTRGEKLNDESIEKRIRELLYKEKPLNELLRKIKTSKGNYSGTFYSNYFRVDHPIRLVDIGFYGPSDVEYGSYFVHIELFAPSFRSKYDIYPNGSTGKLLAKTRRFITVKKESTFFVEPCSGGLHIRPGVWHLIQFMLEGPNTFRCENTVQYARVNAGNNTQVNFEFDSGSMQMPCMRFVI